MKVGDLVKNVIAITQAPWVGDLSVGHLGIVTNVRQTDMNALYHPNGKGDVYIDVILSVDGMNVRCGNYLKNFFEVVT